LSGKYTCAITSLFTPAQALVANAAGARYALYYHNRAKKLLPDGANLPWQIADMLKRTDTILVAASLKSPDELVEARRAGARILSAPFEVLKQLPTNEHAQAALDDFDARGVGLINNIKEQQ
jgi:transaldolase